MPVVTRRAMLSAAGIAAAAGLIAARPRSRGGPHAAYFAALNQTLRRLQIDGPTLVLDLERLERNIARLTRSLTLAPAKNYRVVVKSLPSLPLLDHVARAAGTRSFMSFHRPFLSQLVAHRPDADVLLGKPLPVEAAARFYRDLNSSFQPDRQLQWLIDSTERLAQYRELARALGTSMRVSLEIDVGLHRGGFELGNAFLQALETIAADPQHLQLSGFMGYDAHVASLPGFLAGREARAVRTRYESFKSIGRQHQPALFERPLVFNGAGSMTFRLYEGEGVLNDISVGSCLVKPTHFDLPLLDAFEPAAFIATPVLKRLAHTRLPNLEWAAPLVEAWDPNRAYTLFLYSGNWLAQYESPPGLVPFTSYNSSNQQGVNAAVETRLGVDDFVFLRPLQSEAVLLQFGDLLVLKGGESVGRWPVLEQHT